MTAQKWLFHLVAWWNLARGPHRPRDDVRAAPRALGGCTASSRVSALGHLQAGTQQGQGCRSLCATTEPVRSLPNLWGWDETSHALRNWDGRVLLQNCACHSQKQGRLPFPKSKESSSPSCLGSCFFAMNADSAEHQIAVLCFPVKETLNSTNFPRKCNVFPRKSVFFLYKTVTFLHWYFSTFLMHKKYSSLQSWLSKAWVRVWAPSLSRYFCILLWRYHHTSLKMHLISLSQGRKVILELGTPTEISVWTNGTWVNNPGFKNK